jgi:hypothetical protein
MIENTALVGNLVAWVAKEPRSYDHLMEVWRTSCPRLQVWEEAIDLGLVKREWSKETGATVRVTDAGRSFLTTGGNNA